MKYIAELLSEEKYQLGESPFYDPRTKLLSWVDITEGLFYIMDENGNKKHFNFNKPIGAAMATEKKGQYLIAGSDGLYLLSDNTKEKLLDLTPYYKSYQRSNDAKSDPAGRLWFGSSVDDGIHEASGNLFCLNQGKVNCMQADTKISNGLAWNKAANKFYFSDSLEHAVFEYDYNLKDGSISGRKVLFEVKEGVSDGMCIDTDDNLWVAIWGGHKIEERSTKDGSLISTVHVDAENVSSCCFYGKNMDTLFITSSGKDLRGKHDGCLFTCKVNARGQENNYLKI
ncbi:SMP-30/gluconolactonase/LRE family protein [Treponema sp.]|uniref:SMP-30/gluconolactonase/LRE family protein n=1 Tax=Treponema sp. TaxID=166 RepID=UPI0025E27D0F|nr:SMP-30/gluconolactonase/LRE family protein [Treponema sp.]MCR5217092.1 SMP-30/gluconolactonase/LRE family protein [Treponema sp.]